MSLDYILLALLDEPASGYDLKQVFDESIAYFWPAELPQVYRTLKRLEGLGLLKSHEEASSKGPDRRVYERTLAGRVALRAWLRAEPQVGDERFGYLAQVFFMSDLGDLGRTLEFIRTFRESRRKRLAVLRAIEKTRFAGGDKPAERLADVEFHYYLTLRMGIRTMSARIRWCDETIQLIEQRIRSARRKKKRISHKEKKR